MYSCNQRSYIDGGGCWDQIYFNNHKLFIVGYIPLSCFIYDMQWTSHVTLKGMVSYYSIMCPEEEDVLGEMSILTIMSKVRLEAFMWGAGTALGKLSQFNVPKVS